MNGPEVRNVLFQEGYRQKPYENELLTNRFLSVSALLYAFNILLILLARLRLQPVDREFIFANAVTLITRRIECGTIILMLLPVIPVHKCNSQNDHECVVLSLNRSGGYTYGRSSINPLTCSFQPHIIEKKQKTQRLKRNEEMVRGLTVPTQASNFHLPVHSTAQKIINERRNEPPDERKMLRVGRWIPVNPIII